jgi:drug/metabolite transporter (DMT)-like permease
MNLALPVHFRSDNLRGILAMAAAMGSLILNDAFLKMAAAGLPIGEAIFLRGVIATLLCITVIAATVGTGALRHGASGRLQTRAGADVVGTILYLSALMHMPIADATAILQFTRVGWRRWLATLVGLVGVLIIVRPGGAGFNGYALLALGAIGFVVARDLATRRIGPEVPAMVVAATSAAAVAAGALLLTAIETWAWPSPSALLLLLMAGLGLVGGNYWIVVAMRTGEIAAVAPFRYSASLWAIAAGFMVWGELPDLWTWTGMAIVTAAGIYTILRESRIRAGSTSRLRPASPGRRAARVRAIRR